jgi:hypothetical protein
MSEKGFQNIGFTLILGVHSLFAFGLGIRFTMFLLISTAVVFIVLGLRNSPIRHPSVATSLFERANAIKGQNPREANELRVSAMAFLSVAR